MLSYQLIIFIGIVQGIIFFGHWFLYKTLVFFFSLSHTFFIGPIKIILGLLSISFLIATFLSVKYSGILARAFYVVSASWMGFLDFLFLASISAWIVYAGVEKFNLPFDHKAIAVVFFVIAIATGIYGIINANNPRIKNISVKLPNLPEYWKGKTAVWVSDIHLGAVRREDFAQNIADKIKSVHPDLVFIGGDLFDGGTIDLDDFAVPFSEISSSGGIYFITGNHEEFFNGDAAYLKAVKTAGIRILDNEIVNVKGLQIAGVGWNDAENPVKYKSVLDKINLDNNLPSILLKHAPSNLQASSGKGFSLQISGHTHVGQIFPVNLIVKLVYHDYAYGLRKLDGMQVYTSSGAGTWGPPMRVGNTPEIVVIKFE